MMGLAHRGWALHDSSHHIVDRLREGGYHSDLIGEQRVSRDPGGARLRRGSRHHQQPRRHRGAAGRLPPRVRDPPNCGDGPTKDELIAMGWPSWGAEREQLCDLRFDPNEMHNLIADPRWSQVADELRTRLELWMCETDDPLLDGPVELPPEARVNSPVQRSAADPPAVQASAA